MIDDKSYASSATSLGKSKRSGIRGPYSNVMADLMESRFIEPLPSYRTAIMTEEKPRGDKLSEKRPATIDRFNENYFDSSRKPKIRRSMTEALPHIPLADDRVDIIVELLPGTMHPPRQKFSIPSKATAGELLNHLIQHFKVGNGKWKLYGRVNKDDLSHILDKNTPIQDYTLKNNKMARLYFYPEIKI